MSKSKQRRTGSDIYTLVASTQMSDADRRAAELALVRADAIVNALMWAKERLVEARQYFLKPHLKN